MNKELRKIVKEVFSKNSFSDLGFVQIKSDFDYDITFKLCNKPFSYFILLNFSSKYEAISVFFGWSKGDTPVKRLIPTEFAYNSEENALFDIRFLDKNYKSNSFEMYDVCPGKYYIYQNEIDEYKTRTKTMCESIKEFLLERIKTAILKKESSLKSQNID